MGERCRSKAACRAMGRFWPRTFCGRRCMPANLRLWCFIAVALLTAPADASAQETPQPLADVLSFLLTNQSVPTGDFVKDAQAASVTRDTITRLLLVELTTVPLGSSSAGFTYRVNPALGTIERASQSVGPLFVERSLTAGRGRASIGVNLQFAKYTRLNGVDLESGEFVATGNQFRDEAAPFDVETLSMKIQSRTLTVLGNVGVTNRLDVGVAVPVVWLSLEGSRVTRIADPCCFRRRLLRRRPALVTWRSGR